MHFILTHPVHTHPYDPEPSTGAGAARAIIIEHINRMEPGPAPDWPDAERDGTHRIVVDGVHCMTCETTFGTREAEDPTERGLIATAKRLVNAIPMAVAAPPGVTTSLDLPLTTPTNSKAFTR